MFIYLFFPSRQSPIPFDYGGWDNGSVRHILPQFDHEQLLVKISFEEPRLDTPKIESQERIIHGRPIDRHRRFWTFYTSDLIADTKYPLVVVDSDNKPLCDLWNIRTLPHPDSATTDLRILKYTCAGGISESLFGQEVFLDMKYRRALLKKALESDPRIVIANGDHIYWDQKTSEKSLLQKILKFRRERAYGKLDLNKPMIDPENISVIEAIGNDQIDRKSVV